MQSCVRSLSASVIVSPAYRRTTRVHRCHASGPPLERGGTPRTRDTLRSRGVRQISHIAARTPDGMIVINLWESAEGSEQAVQDPEVQAAREAMAQSGAGQGPPEVEHYEVEDYRQSQG